VLRDVDSGSCLMREHCIVCYNSTDTR